MTIPALDLAAITYSPKNNVIGGGAGQALWLLGATKSLGSGNYTFLGDANDSSQAYADGPYRIGILMLAGQLSLGSGNQTIAGSAATAADSATLVYGITFRPAI